MRALPLVVCLAGCSIVLDPSDLVGAATDGAVADGGTGVDATPGADSGPVDGSHPDSGDGPLVPASDVAAGRLHTCAIREADGAVFCWGSNENGRAGQASDASAPTPARVALPTALRAQQVALGEAHSCALVSDGRVFCWGYNDAGRAHDRLGTNAPSLDESATPLAVMSVEGAFDLAVGFWHACAVVAGGDVRCWGQNASGELGSGISCTGTGSSCAQISGFVYVAGVSDAVGVAAGSGSSCALLSDTTLTCWGYDPGEQLGIGMVATPAPPTPVSYAAGFTRVAAGGGNTFMGDQFRGHICAIHSTDGLLCWGANDDGQSIDSDEPMITVPTRVGELSDVTDVALGYDHTCAVYGGGSVTCWGDGGDGKLGVSSSIRGARDEPIELPGFAQRVAAGARHSCALLDDGSLYCWGSNDSGQLGVPGATGPTPVRVLLPED